MILPPQQPGYVPERQPQVQRGPSSRAIFDFDQWVANCVSEVKRAATSGEIQSINLPSIGASYRNITLSEIEVLLLKVRENLDLSTLQEDELFFKVASEVCKVQSEQSLEALAKALLEGKINDEALKTAMAKAIAANSKKALYVLIEQFSRLNITSNFRRFEFAKIAVTRDHVVTSNYIENCGDLSPNQLFEVVKIAAAQGMPLLFIKKCRDLTQHQLFEVAKITAAHDGCVWTSYYIKEFGSLTQDQRFEVAKIAAARAGKATSQYISNYFPLSEDQKLSIFMIALSNNPQSLQHFDKYEFKTVKGNLALEAFEELSKQNPDEVDPRTVWQVWSLLRLQSIDPSAQRWIEKSGLIDAIKDFRNISLRYALVERLASFANDPNARSRFDELQKLAPHAILANLVLTSLEAQFVPASKTKLIHDILVKKKRTYRDAVQIGPVVAGLCFLTEDQHLTAKEKGVVLEKMAVACKHHPNDTQMLAKQGQLIQGFLGFKEKEMLKTDDTIGLILEKLLKQKVPIDTTGFDFAEKWVSVIEEQFRRPELLLVYAGKLSTLPEPDKSKLMIAYGQFLRSVMLQTFSQERYGIERNPHLAKVSPLVNLDGWKKNHSRLLLQEARAGKAVAIDFTKILKDKILQDKHLDPEKFPFIADALHGKSVEPLLEQEIQKAPDNSVLQLQRLLIQLAKGGNSDELLPQILEQVWRLKTKTSDFQHDIEGLIHGLIITFTDDPCDLFLCGTEVEGSCLRVDGDQEFTKCLLGFVLNGANKLIAVKDPTGKIVARRMLRLLIADEKPVLFVERVYPSVVDPTIKKALEEEAMRTAKALGVPLLELRKGAPPFPHPLVSHEGPTPYEYTDAGGGVMPEGEYEISGATILSVT